MLESTFKSLPKVFKSMKDVIRLHVFFFEFSKLSEAVQDFLYKLEKQYPGGILSNTFYRTYLHHCF